MIDNVAKVYAKALYEISLEQSSLNLVEDFTNFTELINCSNNLENLLFYESFSAEEKLNVLKTIFEKEKYSKYFTSFISLLIKNKRIKSFPEIFTEITVLDDHSKGFLRGTIESPNSNISAEIIDKIKNYLENKIGKKIILENKSNKKISAGVRVTVGDLLLDATLENQFDILKRI